MNDNLSKDDLLELERRRMIESVTESVESTLRKRYTWLAIIISFLIGSGVTTAVISLTGNVQKKLLEAEILLDRSKKSVEEVDRLSNTVKDKYEEVDRELFGAIEGRTALVENLAETAEQLQLLDNKVNSLTKAVNSILKNQGSSKSISTTKNTVLPKTLDRISLSKYTIYLHYSQKEDRPKIETLQQFLKSKGYVVPGIQAVKENKRDIRYFNPSSHDAAIQLRDNVYEFIKNKIEGEDIEIKVKDLSYLYPDVKKTLLEIWLYF